MSNLVGCHSLFSFTKFQTNLEASIKDLANAKFDNASFSWCNPIMAFPLVKSLDPFSKAKMNGYSDSNDLGRICEGQVHWLSQSRASICICEG